MGWRGEGSERKEAEIEFGHGVEGLGFWTSEERW